jgi:glycosyltransferase involved in cell wall biosynthesis
MTPRLRILMIGPVNSPHMEDLALALKARGHLLQAGGSPWAGGLPPSQLPDKGVPVSVASSPHLLWLRRLVHDYRPDVIHANWMSFAALAALAGVRPLVAMAWGSDVYLATGRRALLNRVAVRRANFLLADSAALVDELRALGAPQERSAVLNWGIDVSVFRPAASREEQLALRSSLGLEEGPVILSSRGLKPMYNQPVLLDAFRQLSLEHPDVQLVLKDPGGGAEELASMQLPDRVHVVGRVSHERLADYYRAADVCVSIPSSDSSPRTVWEAMACGCPCVISDLPWVYELIQPDVHALVVPIDARRVANALERLLTEADLHQRVAAAASELVRHHRDWATELDRLEHIYLLAAGRST